MARHVIFWYTLPTGALAASSPVNKIAISWEGNRPLIEISQQIAFQQQVLIRKK
jgi:hypothetical protein